MGQFKSIIFIIAVIGLAILFSGCTGGQDVTSMFKALPEVQQFMIEHPNAQITVTYWSKEEVAQSSQEISQQCDKPITPVAMYKATVSEGNLKIVSWINAENQIVMCSTTTGSGMPSKITPTSTTTTTTNDFKIINLDVQQVILSESEIMEIIGFDWKNTFQRKQGQSISLEYKKQNGDIRVYEIDISVFPNITATKEAYSLMVSTIGKNQKVDDIKIGDAGKIIESNIRGSRGYQILFIKNNVYVVVTSTVDKEIAYNLAKKQDEKISRILDMTE